MRLEAELKPMFKDAVLDHDLSDLRHVAHAIAAEVPFFVTRDARVLSWSETIFEKYGLRILHPTDLINHLDTLRREAEYRPSSLEGSRWRERLVTKDDVKRIVAEFKHPSKDRVGDFERTVRHYLAHPDKWDSRLILDNENAVVVYLVRSNGDPEQVEIHLIRHSDHPLAPTLLRHIFHALNRSCGQTGDRITSVSDPEMSGPSKSALADIGFFADGDKWWKLSVEGILTRQELAAKISSSKLPAPLKDKLSAVVSFAAS